jgi:uncharacterized membrane-anchored protein
VTPLRKALYAAVVALQVAVLLGMIWRQERILDSPVTVRLKCEPVDPRSLVSGDYVRLNYTISRLDDEGIRNLAPGRSFDENDEIFVALAPDPSGAFHTAAAYAATYEALAGRYDLIIRGEVASDWSLEVRYGVEEYFVPQDEGKRIERRIGPGEVIVEVALAADGASAIKHLFVDGAEVAFY